MTAKGTLHSSVGRAASVAAGVAMLGVCLWVAPGAMCAGVAASAPGPGAASAKEDRNRIEAIVRTIYHPYLDRHLQPPVLSKAAPWTKGMQKVVDGLQRCEQKSGDELIDADPIIQAQDYRLSQFSIDTAVAAAQGTAIVRVRFKNLGDWTKLRYDFVHEGGQWRVDNIASGGSDLRSEIAAGTKEEKC